MGTLEDISQALIGGEPEEVERLAGKALADRLPAGDILRKGLIAGMDVVGDRFRREEMFVPEVLISAKAMRAGLKVIQPHLAAGEADSSGTVVLGTVQGDLHDIGKNLVGMMLEGAGFKVVDLGVDNPPERFVAAVREHKPHVVGMSALLTTTMTAMGETIRALEAAGLRGQVKVVVGGAPLTQDYASKIRSDGYAPDASAAVSLVRKLVG